MMNTPRTWLADLRKHQKLTQAQLADRLKISRTYYADLERGEKEGRYDVAKRIAEYFHVPITWVFEGPQGEKVVGRE